MKQEHKKIKLEIKEKIKSFPDDSVIRNLFLCELVPGFGPDLVFRGATITKEGAEYLNEIGNNKCIPYMCGFRWWAINADDSLSDLEEWLEKSFAEKGEQWAVPPEFLHRWRQ